MPSVGDVVSFVLDRDGRVTAVTGEVLGVRADFVNRDVYAILVAGIDSWIQLDESVKVRKVNG